MNDPVDFDKWPERARIVYRGMLESIGVNGRILVPIHLAAAAEEIASALEEGRIPRVEALGDSAVDTSGWRGVRGSNE